jgi:hypothetical protein
VRPLPIALILLLAGPLAAGAAQVSLSSSAQTVTVAEHVELRVVVRAEAGIEGMRVEVPAGDYDIVGRARRPAARSAEGTTFEEVITVAFFRTGEFTVGPFRVVLLSRQGEQGSEETGRVSVRVRSLLGENDKDIKPLKDLLAIRGRPWHLLRYAAAVLLLLLLGAALLLALRKRRGKRRAGSAPPLPPETELEMRVAELRRRNLPQAGEFRKFFIALSDMIKRFLQRAYGFNAEECTSAETVARLRGSESAGEIVAHLEAIFMQADLVKFARQVPAPEAVEGIWPMIASMIAVHRRRREQATEAADVQAGR